MGEETVRVRELGVVGRYSH